MKESKIIIKEQGRIILICLKDVTHIVCSGYICTIYTTSTQFVEAKLLKEFEQELAKSNFLRINKSTLINLEYVENIKFGKQRMVKLLTGISLQVSRRRIHLIAELFKS